MRRGQPQHHAAWVDSCAGARLTPAVACLHISSKRTRPALSVLLSSPAQSKSCGGEPTRTFPLTPGQVTHVVTNWQGTCSYVTLATSNGWDTNFDNIQLSPLP
jgi:hypothetical protein